MTKLSLKENCLSDTGVRKLTIPQRLLKGGLGELSILDLSLNSSITDDSIKHIIKLNSLTALNLSGTKVTFGYGVAQLMNHTNLCLAVDVSTSQNSLLTKELRDIPLGPSRQRTIGSEQLLQNIGIMYTKGIFR